MRYISPTNLTYISGSYQTLCLCVKMTLRSGEVLGFTDLDVDLTISAVVYRSKVGLEVSAMRWSDQLDDEKTELNGLFSDLTGGLTEAKARTGLYNEAAVEISLVNWSNSTVIVPLKKGKISSFIPRGSGYSAEVSSLFYRLNKKLITRLITVDCNAELGDSRCTKFVISYDGVISGLPSSLTIEAAGFSGPVDPTDLIGGKFVFSGTSFDWFVNQVKAYDDITKIFTFWRPFPGTIDDIFDADFTVYEGCDKTASTCKNRFNNLVNFRGFHLTPDKDRVAISKGPTIENGGYVVGTGEDD